MPRRRDINVNSIVLGTRIASLRTKHGLTQQELSEELSKRCGKTQSNLLISAWEKGRRKPTEDVIPIIAEYFDVSVEYLCGLSSAPDLDTEEEAAAASTEFSGSDFALQLQSSDMVQFDGRVVFLSFHDYTHEDQFAIVNADKRLFVLRDDHIPFDSKTIKAIYTNEPDYMYFKSLNGLYPVDMATLQNGSAKRFRVKMKTSDKLVQNNYNGWYRRNEDKTALVNEEKGYVLPIEGLNIAYYAYAPQKPIRGY